MGSGGRPELPPGVGELLGEGDFRAADEGAWSALEGRMGFGAWLLRYLTGEDAFGPYSAVPWSGPIEVRPLPTRRPAPGA